MIKFRTLKALCPCGKVERNVDMKTLNTMRVGGKASYLVYPSDVRELTNLINFLTMSSTKYFVLGCGSNVLMCDKKYRGVLIKLSLFNRMSLHKNFLHIEAGVMLASAIAISVKKGLTGLEEGIGIPATIGGAVRMNASAYNFEIARVLRGVHILRNGKVIYLRRKDIKFGYRFSEFLPKDIILSADFKLDYGDKDVIVQRQKFVLENRRLAPRLPSLGSIFKREKDLIVSKFLDDMGFKGMREGDAMVSEAHAGVIVNLGRARCEDVKKLIIKIKAQCFKEKSIMLHEEIKYLN